MVDGPIHLADNVGIGIGCVILPGVTILADSFVLSNSVVSSSFEENSLIGGNPAKKDGDRYKAIPE